MIIVHSSVSFGHITRQGTAPETPGGRVPTPTAEEQHDPDGDLSVQGRIQWLDPGRLEAAGRRFRPGFRQDPAARRGEASQVSLPPSQLSVHHHAPHGQQVRYPSSPPRLQSRRYGQLPEQRPPDRRASHDGCRGGQATFFGNPSFSSPVTSNPSPPSHKTAEVEEKEILPRIIRMDNFV